MARVYVGRRLVMRQTDSGVVGHVYFMQARPDGLVKIGWTSGHPNVRLKRLRATSPTPIDPLAMMKGTLAHEVALHERFADLWSHGEWFQPDPELLEHIKAIGEPWPEPRPTVQQPATRPLRTKHADLDLSLSKEEIQEAKEEAREEAKEEARLRKWAKRITGGCSCDPRVLTFFEWSELYGIPLDQMWQWKVEGFRVDLIGYYVKLRADEQIALAP